MKTALVIELANLPEEGKSFEGELDPALYDLPKRDAKPAGPLYYDLHVQRFENELLVRGFLSSAFEFVCVRTNKEFIKTISIEEFANSFEIDSGNVDLTEALREEVLMAFPAYPRCDEADEPLECKIDERYLAVDKDPNDGVDEAPQSTSDDRWDALDQLDQFKD
ncbi:YceD family protein [Rubritalea tangerina]|uniref:YceD family protein n=1 Tax=Rubritalea tangerina TaxID=430798 RepID=A0ABW4Z6G2_9BACT